MPTSNHWLDQRKAIEGAFAAANVAATVLYENTKQKPPSASEYVQLTILTGSDAEYASVGSPPRRRYRGVVLVRCFVPEGTGSAAGETLATTAEEVFFNAATGVGKEIASGANGRIVFDKPPTREIAGNVGGFYSIILNAQFYRDQQGA